MRTINCLIVLWAMNLSLSAQDNKIQSDKLKLVWETNGFDTPESVCFDAQNNIFYVSNVGGKNPTEKDGNGFISKLNPDGTILQLKWIEGLNAPKGMAIFDGYLFVTDIDKLVIIDISIAEIEEELAFYGAKFLNDIAVAKDGTLYLSDSQTKSIFRFHKGSYNPLVTDESFESPNGIIYDEATVIAGVGNSIVRIDPATGKWEKIIDNTGGVDGLAKVSNSTYLISDWSGRIYLAYTNKDKELILDTTPIEGRNAADFYFSASDNTVFVPTFFGNSVVCYMLKL
jgi:hypothetical protein